MKFIVVGPGDHYFQDLYNNLKQAIIKKKIICPITVYEPEEAPKEYIYSAIPALFINETLISAGKSLSTKEIIEKISTYEKTTTN